MVRFPYIIVTVVGLLIVLLHNLGDSINVASGTLLHPVWTLLHQQGRIVVFPGLTLYCFYPILPYLGLICTGYAAGKLFASDMVQEKRKRFLLITGLSCIGVFILLRLANVYGDPRPWVVQTSLTNTILSFINCNKYPVSLLFALMTLGPSILFLGFMEGIQNLFTSVLVIIGKVPLFYYLLHIYLIHTLAMLSEDVNPASFMHITQRFHLWAVYLIWIGTVSALYFPCKWYGHYKAAHPEKWWLSYL